MSIDWPAYTDEATFVGPSIICAYVLFRCAGRRADGARCKNEARYLLRDDPRLKMPSFCGIHDITDNHGRGVLLRRDPVMDLYGPKDNP